jgi:hypothetical protein
MGRNLPHLNYGRGGYQFLQNLGTCLLIYTALHTFNSLCFEKLKSSNNAKLTEIILLEFQAKLNSCSSELFCIQAWPWCWNMILKCTLHGIGHEFQDVCFKYESTNLEAYQAYCSKTLLVVTWHFQKGKLLKKKVIVNDGLNPHTVQETTHERVWSPYRLKYSKHVRRSTGETRAVCILTA